MLRLARLAAAAASAALLTACALLPAADPIPFDRRPVPERDPGSALPAGWQHGAFMEIFVRAWRDSDGDGIGDLRGLTASLPYLQELGIKGIWLMPITRSADHDHGYAVTDFRGLEPAYGTLADFDALIREAHARGIGVIMDYVINHAAREHPAFRDAAASAGSAQRDWFLWQPEAPAGWDVWGKNPWYPAGGHHYYATFGPHMPDFNLRDPAALAYHHDSLRFWLNRGLDGFRFDAVPHLIENSAKDWNDQPESAALMRGIRALMDQHYPGRWLVCEATASPQRWAGRDACGSAFAFGLEHPIIDAARGKLEALAQVAAYFTSAPPTMATMLSNHDIFAGKRLRDQLGGDDAAYRLAAATYLLLPGTPFIYYGEEIGMAGVAALQADEPLRTPMSWTADAATGGGFTRPGVKPFRPASDNVATHNVAAQQADPASLLAHYKTLLALRNTLPSIAQGRYEAPQVNGLVVAFQRATDAERTLVLINYGKSAATIRVDGLGANARFASEYPAGGARAQADADGRLHFALGPQSWRVLRKER
ncbi:DUF3459 domain-containing protein [Aquincola sp. S2]|uniref:DUF3459 domain-containing protein n=1 Tax=Pseudaquabacterium terrae TaxID=2732868 RepID=A0ABX2EI84_9BURK|nr:alpha-amylase family glycosyl hydrolase [Aquabacterium terrae]NRF68357.1 DUF3459 domain-containing protein [Aquabacterium terrae]